MTRTPDDLVRMEVHYCVSYLVSTLARGAFNCSTFNETAKELDQMCEQAFDLAAPVDDWEEAAREAGADCHKAAGRDEWRCWSVPGDGGDTTEWCASESDAWRNWCEQNDIEPYEREVYEHWIVSDWLADKLEERGEKVDRDFAGMTVWARTTTGQGIASDSVIESICHELAEG